MRTVKIRLAHGNACERSIMLTEMGRLSHMWAAPFPELGSALTNGEGTVHKHLLICFLTENVM